MKGQLLVFFGFFFYVSRNSDRFKVTFSRQLSESNTFFFFFRWSNKYNKTGKKYSGYSKVFLLEEEFEGKIINGCNWS